jgi:dipeptidyl-peptidase-4
MHTTLVSLSSAVLLIAAAAAFGDAPPAKDAPLDASFLRLYAETRGFSLGRPVRAKPTPDGKAVLFLRAQAKVPKLRLYEFDVETGKTRELLTPEAVLQGAEEHLTPEEKARRERQRVSVGGFTDFQLSPDGGRILVSLSGKLYLVERDGGKVRELPTGDGAVIDPKFSPDGRRVAYVRGHDVYVLDLGSEAETAVTSGGTEKKTHGLAEFVAQEEMNRFSGYWWAPDSASILFEEADADGVEVWYVSDPARPEEPAFTSYYPRPGKANVKVRLGLVSTTPATHLRPSGAEPLWLEWDAKAYPYLAGVKWEKEGPLTLLVQDREQKEQALLKVDPATGKTTPLLTERDVAWVNLRHDCPRWLEDGSFLWVAETTDGPRLERRDKDGPVKAVVVSAEVGFQELVDVDPKSGQVVYRASTDPTQAQLFRVSADGGNATALTKEPGAHAAAFGKGHSVYVESFSAAGAMPKATVHKADGALVGELPSVAEEPGFSLNSEVVKVGDDPGFYCYVVRPHDFDAGKRYPVVVHVYGGPTHQQVTATMGGRLIDQWIADQGFIVAAVDNRGTPGRGRDWERAVSGHFGSVPLEDQIAGLKALGKRFPEMDLDRVGIYGWSFGGYLSALAVLKAPDVYKAAAAGAPVVDWTDYDTHYTERYLGLPDKDEAGYREASLLTYAADLKRPLLLIHGTADDNVYFRHTLKLTNALFRADKDFDLLPLAGMTHMTPDPVVTERLYGKIAGHFRGRLGKPEAKKGE